MNRYTTTLPRFWFLSGISALVIGALVVGPPTLWDSAYAADRSRWELMAFFAVLSILFGCAGCARWMEEFRPDATRRIVASIQGFKHWMWLGFGIWLVGWSLFHGITDPDWIPSGIDWHDTHLDAYALLHNDPPLYCSWRYPLFPAIAAGMSSVFGLDLSISEQLLSRVLAIGTAIPLFYVGRTLFGRGAAVGGIILLIGLATYRMHTDAVTPYPLVMFLAATGAAGLVAAARGGIIGFAVTGISIAALLANDGKSLLIGLGFAGLGLLMAVALPWRWAGETGETPKPFRGPTGGGLLRLSRTALIALPIVLSYQWMASLPVKAFTLEEMAVAYLIPGGRDATQAPIDLQKGYMWGHLESPWTIPTTLKNFYEAGKNPEMAEQNATQRRTSMQRLRLDYPGFSPRVLWVLGFGLLLPVLRTGQTRAQRIQRLLQVAAVLAVLASCWPSIKSDYQERYVVHGTVWIPLLLMGTVGWLSGILVRNDTPMRKLASGIAPVLCAIGLLFWSGNPVSLTHLQDRLDPVAMGGKQEFEVQQWAKENMQTHDWLLDTSWMMQALLVSGENTVARAPNAYPPGGAPWPAGSWRFTRPWPGEGVEEGEHYALVNFLAMAPDTFHGSQVPIEELVTQPDSDIGKQIIADKRWKEVFRTSDTIVRVYRWTPTFRPPGWPRTRHAM